MRPSFLVMVRVERTAAGGVCVPANHAQAKTAQRCPFEPCRLMGDGRIWYEIRDQPTACLAVSRGGKREVRQKGRASGEGGGVEIEIRGGLGGRTALWKVCV